MVALLNASSSLWPLLAQHAEGPLLKQLDPPRRAVVVMALLALVLLGITLVVLTMIGARWVRRLARSRPATRSTATSGRSTARRAARPRQGATSETVVHDRRSDETIS